MHRNTLTAARLLRRTLQELAIILRTRHLGSIFKATRVASLWEFGQNTGSEGVRGEGGVSEHACDVVAAYFELQFGSKNVYIKMNIITLNLSFA